MPTTWPHDDTASKVKFYGDPRVKEFENKYLVLITPPFQMYYDKHPLKAIRVNKMIASSLLRVFNNVLEKCGHDQKKIDAIGISAYGGCYNFRPIRGSTALSNHAFGAAIDLDPENNVLGSKSGKMSPITIQAFKDEGWLWGGDYKGRKDYMHFEAVSR
jgi:hypothetical protein